MNLTVLVTGCSRGIGRAIAESYAALGACVIGTATGPERPAHVADYLQVDFSDPASREAACERVAGLGVDVLINNAGINKVAGFLDVSLEDFERLHRVNVVAPLRLSQAVLPHMVERGWGRIVNVTSVLGKMSKAGRASYSASKFALDGMTVALATEYASRGILANSVAPGFVDSDMLWTNLGAAGVAEMLTRVPIGRLARAEEIANLVCWLGSEENTFVSGQNIAIDGGFTRA